MTTRPLARLSNPAVLNSVGGQDATGLGIFQTFLTNFIVIAFGIGAIVLVFMLIVGGIQYLSAGSDKEAVQRASKRLTHALVGIAIMFSVYAVVAIIGIIFGLSILEINFPQVLNQ